MKVSFKVQIPRAQADESAMKKMATSNVLIVGMKGLGVEIGKLLIPLNLERNADGVAKNVALAGVKTVTVYDPSPVEIADLGTQVCSQEIGSNYVLIYSSFCEKRILENQELRSLHQDWQN